MLARIKYHLIMELENIIKLLNQYSKEYNFGDLQNIRKDLFSLERKPSNYPFGKRAIFNHYAFHLGGRNELQFNVGFEDNRFRWGVAISLQPSQSVPNIDVMIPKIERLNEFMRLYNEEYLGDFLMWHFQNNDRSEDRLPHKVPASLIKEGVFMFLGKHTQKGNFNPNIVLQDFDRLLYLYKFVEGGENAFPNISESNGFHFNPEHAPRKSYNTKSTSRHNEIDVSLQHRLLLDQLVKSLQNKSGIEVGSEHKNGIGGRIDVIVKKDDEFDLIP